MSVSDPKSETAKREEAILNFWREDRTFEKSLEKAAPEGEFVFYDGPPFATGLPHHGSLLSSIIKDVIPRYKTMRGYRVRRRWGWDCHGLPIESLVEKELGLKTKKDIYTIGVKAFNEKARSMVLAYVSEWEKYVERIGRWVDFRNSYKTMDNTYIESVWWALKQLWEKKLLYEGKKVLMYCPHCETPLAKAEIAMDNTYKDITEEAVTVKFKVRNPGTHNLPENTYLLAWTTTPWTLPGNVGLAVGPDIAYYLTDHQEPKYKGRSFIISGGAGAGTGRELRGRDLVGIEYEALFDVPALQSETSYKVYAADFVSTDEGTGIVHTAVMYGEDDFVLGQREDLPQVQLLNPNGTYNEKAPGFLQGKYIKDAEKDIKRNLESHGLLFEKKNHTHSYPHCYRCGTPLIYNAVSSWFINIQNVKAKMLSENEKVHWVPEHLKRGRFKNIVESAPDWTISRNRFWASPLPIWKERGGDRVTVIGSIEELRRRVKKSGNRYFVMRHGEAENNAKNIVSSGESDDHGLTEVGRAQVRAAAGALPKSANVVIYSSPLRRTRESANIVAEILGIERTKITVNDELREFDFGDFNNRSFQDFVAYRAEHMRALGDKVPGGESYLDGKIRFGNFLRTMEAEHVGTTVVIVTHGIGCESFYAAAEGASEEESWRIVKERHFEYAFCSEIPYAPLPVNDRFELDLHRPYTDGLVLLDDEGREYERIQEVVDCWVESGSMPFAEYHYPFENSVEFEKRAPGDFIAEYIAQTRTWFYYMHAIGVLLFNRLAFKNVVSTGTVLAADGEKISKSKRNYTDPLELIDRYGADALRLSLMGSPVMQAEDVRFRDEDVRDTHNRIVGILWNSFKFFELYKNELATSYKLQATSSPHVLDRWILARLDEVVRVVTNAMDAYDTQSAVRVLKDFVDDYSTWYVRRSRERVKAGGDDQQHTLRSQRHTLATVAKMLAPIAPFLAEALWRGIDEEGSVHLSEWPSVSRGGWLGRLWGRVKADPALAEMSEVRLTVSRALEARDRAGIKVRQPLGMLTVSTPLTEEYKRIIAEEVNVKHVAVDTILSRGVVTLDIEITPALKEEGLVRDAIRAIQAARKEAHLAPGEIARAILASADAEMRRVALVHREDILAATNLVALDVEEGAGGLVVNVALRSAP